MMTMIRMMMDDDCCNSNYLSNPATWLENWTRFVFFFSGITISNYHKQTGTWGKPAALLVTCISFAYPRQPMTF